MYITMSETQSPKGPKSQNLSQRQSPGKGDTLRFIGGWQFISFSKSIADRRRLRFLVFHFDRRVCLEKIEDVNHCESCTREAGRGVYTFVWGDVDEELWMLVQQV